MSSRLLIDKSNKTINGQNSQHKLEEGRTKKLFAVLRGSIPDIPRRACQQRGNDYTARKNFTRKIREIT